MRSPSRSRILIVGLAKRMKEEVMVRIGSTKSLGRALAMSVVLSAALETIYYYGGIAGQADSTPLRAALVGAACAAGAGLVVWRSTRMVYAAAESDRLARRTVALGVVAVGSLAGFWIGITVPVCVAAAALGRRATVAGRPRCGHLTSGVAGAVLVVSVVLCVLGAS
jgi:hypothetical protein